MDPNNTNPSNTPPAGETPAAQPPVPEVPATPAESPVDASPAPEVATPATPAEPVAPAEPTAPVQPGVTPGTTPEVAPAAAPASVFSTASGAPQAPKSSNKKTLTIGAIVAGVILLAIAGVVAFSMLTSVSKEDYRDAARQFNKVSAASSSLTSDARSLGSASSSASDERFEESVTEAEASITTLNTENETLSKMKAVRVGEGAKLYGTFNDKLKAYSTYGAELVTSVKNLRPALAVCNNVGDAEDAAARVTALKACSTALTDVKDVPNAQFKTYVDAIAKSYGEYATVYEKISALSNPYGAQYEEYKTLRDQMYAVQDTISDASDTFSSALKARDEELSVKASADALADYLTEQQK